MGNKKFELVADWFIEVLGTKLFRIRALRSFGAVRAGTLGGYIEKESNLSHDGTAWVCDGAQVFGGARVRGNARVSGDAWVYGNARVSDNAWVHGNARVCGNASVFGNAWVFGNARVYDNAVVFGNARVSDNARVYDNAWMYGNARVYGDARVYGNARVAGDAKVYGDARVYGDAWVYGNARVSDIAAICWFSHVGSEGGTLTAFKTEAGISVTRGCFLGTLDEFESAVQERHGSSHVGDEYRLLIQFIRLRLGSQEVPL